MQENLSFIGKMLEESENWLAAHPANGFKMPKATFVVESGEGRLPEGYILAEGVLTHHCGWSASVADRDHYGIYQMAWKHVCGSSD